MKKTRVGALRKRKDQEDGRISRDKQEYLSSHNFRCSFSSIRALQTHHFSSALSFPVFEPPNLRALVWPRARGRVWTRLSLADTRPFLHSPNVDR